MLTLCVWMCFAMLVERSSLCSFRLFFFVVLGDFVSGLFNVVLCFFIKMFLTFAGNVRI